MTANARAIRPAATLLLPTAIPFIACVMFFAID
jgi:hypothetical protein